MTVQGAALNTDSNGIVTSSEYGDPGDGTSKWYLRIKSLVLGEKADAAVTDPTASGSMIALLKGLLANFRTANAYPYGATALSASSGSVAAAAATATLTGAASVTTYLTGFVVTGGGATAASIIAVTVTNTSGGTLTYLVPVPAGATAGITPLVVNFSTPIKANAANTNIVVSAASFGAGNTAACVSAQGYRV